MTMYYAINHESILLDLDRGEIEVFTPISVTPDIPVFEGSVEWNQPNYIAIATTLYEFTGKEISDDWNLYYIRFITACYDNLNGFDFGEIAYFKSIRNDSLQKDYTVRAYQIIPQYGYIVMASGASFPQPLLDRWESANLQESNINAEDVLRIAEDYGSLAARTSVQNNCKIHTRLTGYSGWELRIYANETGHEIFAIGIDPTTGKILFP